MPLSEFYRMNRSSQQKTTTSSADLSFVHDNEVVELIWENGQIMMQGQSNRPRRSPFPNNFPSQTTRLQEKDTGNATTSKMGKFGMMECILNDVPLSVPSCEMGSSQDDEMVPWLNYPIDETLEQDYCSEYLPEISGVTVNEQSTQNSFASTNKGPGCNQMVRDSHNVSLNNSLSLEQGNASRVSSARSGQLYPWASQRIETSMPSHSGVDNNIVSNSGNADRATSGNSFQDQASTVGLTNMKVQKPDVGLPTSNSNLLNFSHFSRPAAIARATLQNIGAVVASSSSGEEKIEKMDKDVTAAGGNNAELILSNSNRDLQKETSLHCQPNLVSSKVDLKPAVANSLEESRPAEQSYVIGGEEIIRNDKSTNQILDASTTQRLPDGEKAIEPVVASSSVCSGNSTERASNDLTNNLKRKCQDDEECEGPSEDVEEDSVDVNIEAPVRGSTGSKNGSKRSRAAEVHNLSERRRRERINEKMRALQELIPNCNKVDKASMLDEAIEYLKTLQLQVQIMSMGAVLYMPPMMLPTGMQHIRAAHMPHFSPMGVGMGMGMGMGFGMGIPDVNAGPPGCPMIPVSPMQGAHFLSAPISGPANLQGIPGSSFQAFGHPGQGLPMSVARAPFLPLSGWSSLNSAMVLNASRMGPNSEILNSAASLNSKDLMQNSNSKETGNADAHSMKQTNQNQATSEGFHLSGLVRNDQAPDASGSGPANPTIGNDVVSSKATSCN